MYHLFEQFIKIYFNVNLEKDYKETNIIASTYNYDIKQNENFELVNKYRLINNAIKHGSIKELSKYYPDLINDIHSDKLNITESELDECFICLFEFVVEMNAYFEDMGYKEWVTASRSQKNFALKINY